MLFCSKEDCGSKEAILPPVVVSFVFVFAVMLTTMRNNFEATHHHHHVDNI
jgi:hypothetical protein